MILLIDNYDSFTFNVKHYLLELGQKVKVVRNDKITVEKLSKLNPKAIVISPGPCTPNEAGISIDLIKLSSAPLLGVCLGHQAIGAAFGGNVIKAPDIYHGKTSNVIHNKSGVFNGINSPYKVVRYHSLIVEKSSLPNELQVTATLEDNDEVIMALEHKTRPIYGVQFHPESIDTDNGKKLIENFLKAQ